MCSRVQWIKIVLRIERVFHFSDFYEAALCLRYKEIKHGRLLFSLNALLVRFLSHSIPNCTFFGCLRFWGSLFSSGSPFSRGSSIFGCGVFVFDFTAEVHHANPSQPAERPGQPGSCTRPIINYKEIIYTIPNVKHITMTVERKEKKGTHMLMSTNKNWITQQVCYQ